METTAVDEIVLILKKRWQSYVADGRAELFTEFGVTLNALAEYFARQRLSGLMRLCEGLENMALAKSGGQESHPLPAEDIAMFQRQVDTLLAAVAASRQPMQERRNDIAVCEEERSWIKSRSVWIIAEMEGTFSQSLKLQLEFFGFEIEILHWNHGAFPETIPLAAIFNADAIRPENLLYISSIRSRCPTSQLVYLGAERNIVSLVSLIRAGIDVTIPGEDGSYGALNCILDFVQTTEPEKSKVLIVEDSRVAAEVIRRTLAPHAIDTCIIADPAQLIPTLDDYQPDLILMDMYMPGFNGIEATRVLRQLPAYSATPVVYLSAESDIGMQVEALRLGGDQFLTKPFNPVLLAAIVKTKIERFREAQRTSQIDGLTGLLNHTSIKTRIDTLMSRFSGEENLTAIMLDIDNFKSVNDVYGHPVGDQVIRSLAWLLKGRLRTSDYIGRYGGEEFLIALPGATAQAAKEVMDRIRNDFSSLPHAHQHGSLYASFSAGIASYPQFKTAKTLINNADHALLEAKRLGRNRCEIANEPV